MRRLWQWCKFQYGLYNDGFIQFWGEINAIKCNFYRMFQIIAIDT
jgi:hypothetical protein